MRLLEHEGKELFKKYSIPVPKSALFGAAKAYPFPSVLKAQVHSGNRKEAGGILFPTSSEEVGVLADGLLHKTINREQVLSVLVEEKITSLDEYYVSFSYDTSTRTPVIAFSTSGGTGTHTASILPVSISSGPTEEFCTKLFEQERVAESEREEIKQIIQNLWKLFTTEYALLAEINPLFKTDTGFVAGDAKIQLDDSSINPGEKRIVSLEGDIAVLASGGGASLLNIDALIRAGGKPANYTEYSGNPPASVVKELTLRVLATPDLKGLWVVGAAANFTDIFITMSGFLEALQEVRPTFPIVIRRDGPRRDEAFAMLRQAAELEGFDIHLYDASTSMNESARSIVELAYHLP